MRDFRCHDAFASRMKREGIPNCKRGLLGGLAPQTTEMVEMSIIDEKVMSYQTTTLNLPPLTQLLRSPPSVSPPTLRQRRALEGWDSTEAFSA